MSAAAATVAVFFGVPAVPSLEMVGGVVGERVEGSGEAGEEEEEEEEVEEVVVDEDDEVVWNLVVEGDVVVVVVVVVVVDDVTQSGIVRVSTGNSAKCFLLNAAFMAEYFLFLHGQPLASEAQLSSMVLVWFLLLSSSLHLVVSSQGGNLYLKSWRAPQPSVSMENV